MLRPGLSASADPAQGPAMWRASSGTAALLGLRPAALDCPPTTAYLMLGQRCSRDCAFCGQARSSRGDEAALSRVLWPAMPAEDLVPAISRAYQEGVIQRACFQVTVGPGHIHRASQAVARLGRGCNLPICASVFAGNLADVEAILASGAERVTIALDAATPQIYKLVKGGSWKRTVSLLEAAAQRFPGQIGTHLIVGLDETEEEMIRTIQWLTDLGVTVGLFAFTPVAGTALEAKSPPSIAQYRRVQAASWLITHGLRRVEQMTFDPGGRLISLGLSGQSSPLGDELALALGKGDAFRTSGCPHCNRPYYNERPSAIPYNYPRPLTAQEWEQEFASLLRWLTDSPTGLHL